MRLLWFFAGLTLTAGSAFGWGCEGHQMVALIARAHLTPAVSTAVDQLLKENPLDPAQKRYCQNRPDDPMADAASWADDMKNIDKTFSWHFVDIPLAVRKSDTDTDSVMKWCEPIGPSVEGKDRPGCITTAIDYEWRTLRDKSQPGPERAKALRYIIHFLGDLSQPLHDTDNHDQGGNCTRMIFFGNERLENLHAIWDERMLGRDLTARKLSQQEYAAGLDREFAQSWPIWGQPKPDVLAWAWEGHEVAVAVTYGNLKPQLPVADPADGQVDKAGCDLERTQVEGMHITIGDEYFNAALPVVRQQLAKAAYRLAAFLNQGF
jgi:hypothetical protein